MEIMLVYFQRQNDCLMNSTRTNGRDHVSVFPMTGGCMMNLGGKYKKAGGRCEIFIR